MNTRLITATISAVLLLSPLAWSQTQKPPQPGMSEDMRQAIEFQRGKDRADARQARIEAHRAQTGQSADRTADRTMDNNDARQVKDKKAPGAKRDQ